ncbi:hypothetical protein C882_2656 [Caenispirillum salinarum AK4]|uniref:Uncharacterized protein n=1 Tax=Caenispirillum salinarum AK4 TaxID=1238182 RepID=K9H4U1_9PROT|nr:hypothetical protein C882_2656 [Caenispirillum salinarum AK4]
MREPRPHAELWEGRPPPTAECDTCPLCSPAPMAGACGLTRSTG